MAHTYLTTTFKEKDAANCPDFFDALRFLNKTVLDTAPIFTLLTRKTVTIRNTKFWNAAPATHKVPDIQTTSLKPDTLGNVVQLPLGSRVPRGSFQLKMRI